MSERTPEVENKIAHLFGAAAVNRSNAGTLEREAAASSERAKFLRAEASRQDAEARAILRAPCGCDDEDEASEKANENENGAAPAAPSVSTTRTANTKALHLGHIHGLRGSFGRILAGLGLTSLEQLATKSAADLRAACPGEPTSTFATGLVAAASKALELKGLKLKADPAAPPPVEIAVETEAPAEEAPAEEDSKEASA